MVTQFICSRFVFFITVLVSGALFFWIASNAEPEVRSSVIESYATQQVMQHMNRYDYGRFDTPLTIEAGHRNDHYVSGSGTFIRFGRDQNSNIPTTEFQKIRYVVVVTVTCARWVIHDCLAVRNIKILNDRTNRPLI